MSKLNRRHMLTILGAGLTIAPPAFATSLSQDIAQRLAQAQLDGKADGLHTLLVSQGGRLVFEYYGQGDDEAEGRGALGTVVFGPDVPHDLRSVSKSVVGLAYGIALAAGNVPPPEDKLYEQFPEYSDLASQPGRDRLTVHHVLSMTLGLDWDELTIPYGDPRNAENAMEAAPDRFRFILERPIVGLLNIGEEVIKGSEVIKRAGELLRAVAAHGHLNYFGNVEGDDIFKGTADVVVCDGFVGNVALKSNEGVAKMMKAMIRQEFERSIFTKLAALVAMPVLRRFQARVDPRRYNGAALLGLKGLVFKSHGGADAFSFGQALIRAHDAARNQLLDGVHDAIVDTMQALPPTGGESVPQAA